LESVRGVHPRLAAPKKSVEQQVGALPKKPDLLHGWYPLPAWTLVSSSSSNWTGEARALANKSAITSLMIAM